MDLTLAQKQAMAEAEARKAMAEAEGGGNPFGWLLDAANPRNQVQRALEVGKDPNAAQADTGYVPSAVPMLDPVNAALNSAVDAIPVIGPGLTKMGNSVDAAFNNALGFPEQTAEDRAGINEADAAEFPVQALAGRVTGTVAPIMAVGGTALGGKLLGMTGNLGQRVAFGAASGGALSGADSLARNGDPAEAIWDALKGAGLGGAAPLAERAIMPILKAMTGVVPRAATVVARGVERDKIDDIIAALEAKGPDAVLADLGPNLTRQAAAIAGLPGEGQTIIRDALMTRHAGTNARIQGTVNDILGEAPIPSRLAAEIQTGKDALAPQYAELFENAAPVNARPLAETFAGLSQFYGIGKRQAAMDKLGGWLTEVDDRGRQFITSDASRLFAMRNELDDLIETEVGTQLGAALTSARQQVDDVLAVSVPGLKDVDAAYQELARQGQAVGQGQQILNSGREALVPDEVSALMASQPASELFVGPSGVPFRVSQGTRAEIERIIGTTANNLTALKGSLKGDGSWNRARLASIFGDEKADDLIRLLDREWSYADNANTVLRNSETAARIAAQGDVAPWVMKEPSMTGLLTKPITMVANAAAKSRSEQVNARIAEALMSRPTPETVDQIIAARNMAIQRALLAPAVPALMATGQ